MFWRAVESLQGEPLPTRQGPAVRVVAVEPESVYVVSVLGGRRTRVARHAIEAAHRTGRPRRGVVGAIAQGAADHLGPVNLPPPRITRPTSIRTA
jgi:hypothetical protein